MVVNAAADANSAKPGGNFPAGLSNGNGYAPSTDGTKLNAGVITGGLAGGSSIPVAIMNPYLTLNYCIAMQGIFPSRN